MADEFDSGDTFDFSNYSNGWGQQSFAPDSFQGSISDNSTNQQSYAPSDFNSYDYMQQPAMQQVPQDTQWGSQSFAPNSMMSNLMQQSTPNFGQTTPNGEIPNNQGFQLPNMGGIQSTLSNLFNSKAGVSGLGALIEGMQNRKKASATNQLVQQMQPAMDPFGSQRAQYQQQLSSAYQDPYSQPIVRDQVAQIQRAQAIKDAAAGRRSNSSTSDPAMLAASAQVAQKYIDSLQTPAGANIGPQGLSSLLQLQQSGMNAGINGMASPMLSALGYNTGTATNSQSMQGMQLTPQQQQALIKMLGTGGQ